MEKNKIRVIQDYEKLSNELKEQIKLVYPNGYHNHLVEYTTPKGERIKTLKFETDEKIYLIRMTIQKAKAIIENDDDFDEDGFLKINIREKYEEEYSDIDYLNDTDDLDEDNFDNDNFDGNFDEEDL